MKTSEKRPESENYIATVTCIYCGDSFVVSHSDKEVAETAVKIALSVHIKTKHKDKLN